MVQKNKKKVKVALQKQPAAAKAAAGGKSPPMGGTMDKHYAMALTKPFDPASYGARVPDLYSAPTQTSHIRKIVTLQSNASGEVSGIVLPSILFHSVASEGTYVGSDVTSWVSWSGGGTVASAALYTNPTDTKAKISNGRVVSYGVRFRNISSMTNVSGRMTCATIPLKDDLLVPVSQPIGGALANDPGFTRAAWYAASGIPHTGSGDSAILAGALLPSLPNSFSLSSLELAEKGLDIVPKVITPYAFGLKNTGDTVVGNDVGPGVATGAIFAGDDDYVKFGGFESVLYSGSGFPASTNVMTLEIVYHVEGTPTLSGGAGLIADTMPKSRVNINAFYGALDFAARAATFARPVLETAIRTLPVFG